jgi:hypothetical protein
MLRIIKTEDKLLPKWLKIINTYNIMSQELSQYTDRLWVVWPRFYFRQCKIFLSSTVTMLNCRSHLPTIILIIALTLGATGSCVVGTLTWALTQVGRVHKCQQWHWTQEVLDRKHIIYTISFPGMSHREVWYTCTNIKEEYATSIFSTLMMEVADSSEILVLMYLTTWHHITKDYNLDTTVRGSDLTYIHSYNKMTRMFCCTILVSSFHLLLDLSRCCCQTDFLTNNSVYITEWRKVSLNTVSDGWN